MASDQIVIAEAQLKTHGLVVTFEFEGHTSLKRQVLDGPVFFSFKSYKNICIGAIQFELDRRFVRFFALGGGEIETGALVVDEESENKSPKLKVFVEMMDLGTGNLFYQRKGLLNVFASDFVVRSSEVLQSHRLDKSYLLGLCDEERQTVIAHFDAFKSPSEMLRSMPVKSAFL